MTSSDSAPSELAAVLAETADRLEASPESPWAGVPPSALAATLRRERASLAETGTLLDHDELRTLFLPTGEIQDAAIDGGWGDAYLDLSVRFDAALAAQRVPPRTVCRPPRTTDVMAQPSRVVQRRRPRIRRWWVGALAVGVVTALGVKGGWDALIGVAVVAVGIAVALAGAFFWVFQDGLFTRLPSAAKVVRDPALLARLLVPLVLSLSLVGGGAWLIAQGIR